MIVSPGGEDEGGHATVVSTVIPSSLVRVQAWVSGIVVLSTQSHLNFAWFLCPLDPIHHHWPLDWLLFLLLPVLLLQLLLWTLPAQIIDDRRGLLCVTRRPRGTDQD